MSPRDARVTLTGVIKDARAGANSGFDLDLQGWRSPYTRLKSDLYCVLAYPVIKFCIRLGIHPNLVTGTYILSSVASIALCALPSPVTVAIGLAIMFLNGSLDWADGFVARWTGKTSVVGHEMDLRAGYVKQLSFVACIGVILTHVSGSYVYAGVTALALVAKAASATLMEVREPTTSRGSFTKSASSFKWRAFAIYDGRARYTDAVIALVVAGYFGLPWSPLAILLSIWCVAACASLLLRIRNLARQ